MADFSLDWAYAHGGAAARGMLRATPEDFVVEEDLGFAPDGQGEHVLVQVQKRGANTEWVARQLARFAGVRPMDVSYAGLKDRHALTTQWFSVHLPGRAEPDWSGFACDEYRVLAAGRHTRKLRRGALAGNRFVIRLHALAGDTGVLAARLAQIRERGVPNYFGEQRFGREGGNLARAAELFAGRRREHDRAKRGMYLSAARSYLFNTVLSHRVVQGTWDQALAGECLVLDGSASFFRAEAIDEKLQQRLVQWDIHPSGPLWGRGAPPCGSALNAMEADLLAPHEAFRKGLEQAGMEQERRPLRLAARDMAWELSGDTLTVSFVLDAGSYATAVLREAVDTTTQPSP